MVGRIIYKIGYGLFMVATLYLVIAIATLVPYGIYLVLSVFWHESHGFFALTVAIAAYWIWFNRSYNQET
jgi:hypothetical protein